jgi:hypothetical protein
MKSNRLVFLKSIGLALLALLTQTTPAYAYIDPNAGGVIFQILAPLFIVMAGAWAIFRRWLHRTLQRAGKFFRLARPK